MTESYEKYIKWWLAEYDAESEYDRLMTLFPEFNTRLAKYAPGVYQWYMTAMIDLTNQSDIELVREILAAIESRGLFDYIDMTFDDCSPFEISKMLNISSSR